MLLAVSGLLRRKELKRNAKREFGKALTLLHAYALVPCAKENKGVRLTVTNQTAGGCVRPAPHLETEAGVNIAIDVRRTTGRRRCCCAPTGRTRRVRPSLGLQDINVSPDKRTILLHSENNLVQSFRVSAHIHPSRLSSAFESHVALTESARREIRACEIYVRRQRRWLSDPGQGF